MEKTILVFGAGGHAKTVISLLKIQNWKIRGIIDDDPNTKDLTVSGVKVLGDSALLPKLKDEGVNAIVNTVGGIGNYSVRWRIFEKLMALGFEFPTLVHPTAFVEDTVTLADGVQVLAQSYISSESSVGFGTLVNAGVVISHDCKIGKCVNLSPGALLAGAVTMEDFSQIGMGATVNLELKVGKRARIGNNATVKADVPADGHVPAGTIWPLYKGRGIRDNQNLRKLV